MTTTTTNEQYWQGLGNQVRITRNGEFVAFHKSLGRHPRYTEAPTEAGWVFAPVGNEPLSASAIRKLATGEDATGLIPVQPETGEYYYEPTDEASPLYSFGYPTLEAAFAAAQADEDTLPSYR